MNKKLRDLMYLVLIFCLVLIGLQIGVREYQLLPVVAADTQDDDSEPGCRTYLLAELASTEMPVPSFCIDGLCKLVLTTDAIFGAFGPGYLWEVYYYQWGSSSNVWVGGPNLNLGGVDFSDGYGENGNGYGEAVFLGGTTSDGGYIRIMDDGPYENDPYLWSIEAKSSESLTQASLQVCSFPGTVTRPNITSHTAIDMPDFCLDSMCMILRFTFANFGAFGQGLSLPVFYQQNSQTESWIGGPVVSLSGVDFSSHSGNNGTDSTMTAIFGGGVADGGGVAQLLDDGAEWSDSQWSVYFEGDDQLNMVYYFIAPMTCERYDVSTTYTNILRPTGCLDALCTVIRWTDAQFGAWGPGLSLPVHYIQRSNSNNWVGGPAICFGGQCFSSGVGLNGDTSAEIIFDSGRTSTNEGYVILRDDSVTAGETISNYWNIVLNAQDDLTSASYFVCSNTCEETNFLLNRLYLPIIDK